MDNGKDNTTATEVVSLEAGQLDAVSGGSDVKIGSVTSTVDTGKGGVSGGVIGAVVGAVVQTIENSTHPYPRPIR